MPTKNKLVYLTPATEDMEEIVKYHLTSSGVDSARRIYLLMKEEIGRLAEFLRQRTTGSWCSPILMWRFTR